MLLRGFRLAIHPCKGILQARLRPHYREKNAVVVGRIRAWSGREGRFFGQSEGLQGFGGMQIFFHKFFRAVLFKNEQKIGVFHYILCFGTLFERLQTQLSPTEAGLESTFILR
jgi:hypothetical protein